MQRWKDNCRKCDLGLSEPSHQPNIPYNTERAIDPGEATIPENPSGTLLQLGILDPFVEVEPESSENQPAKSGTKLVTAEPPRSIPKVNDTELAVLRTVADLERSGRPRDKRYQLGNKWNPRCDGDALEHKSQTP